MTEKLSIDYRPIASLTPYANNARIHTDDQIAEIAASIREFGWTNPVLVDGKSGIVAGHGRVLAAKRLGIALVPCIELSGLTAGQKRAYVIADNQLALRAEWDAGMLSLEMGALKAEGFDLGLLGFDDADLASILEPGTDGETDPDEVPDPSANPIAQPGDIWICGRHRVLCGDATSATDVERLLGGVTPHVMVTDPPYGVSYDPDWRNRADRADGRPYGATAVGTVTNDDRADWSEAYALFPGDVAYVWHPAGANSVEFFQHIVASGFDVRMQIIWAKTRFPIGRGNYHVQHEPCWYAVRKGKTAHWQGSRKESTLWEISHQKSETGHSTQKPVECMRRPIVNNSAAGDAVYDPFLGSGTTIIAAEMEGRRCLGLEIAPQYVDVIVRRWQKFTGKEAALESNGKTFAEIEANRQAA